jgi:hypothetical protein
LNVTAGFNAAVSAAQKRVSRKRRPALVETRSKYGQGLATRPRKGRYRRGTDPTGCNYDLRDADIWFHADQFLEERSPRINDAVSFAIGTGKNGRENAISVILDTE